MNIYILFVNHDPLLFLNQFIVTTKKGQYVENYCYLLILWMWITFIYKNLINVTSMIEV